LILKYVLSFVIDILSAKYFDGKESVNVFRMIISVPEFSAKQEETAEVAQVVVYDVLHDTRLTETMKEIIGLLMSNTVCLRRACT
jgi:hypothetical protein